MTWWASATLVGRHTAHRVKRNAHPHAAGDLHLVHNGIIENYLALKSTLQKRGYDFKSDTDTEVLVALIDSLIKRTRICSKR